jgi:uncharacterized protein (TIGR01777 family)
MPLFERQSTIQASAEKLFNWHTRPRAFERLTPPWESIEVVEKGLGITDGSRVVLKMRQGPFSRRWVAVHSDYIEGKQFKDTQTEGPFAKWVHTHQFESVADKTSQLTDLIEYELPLGGLGNFVAGRYVAQKIKRTFAFRHGRTQNDLKRIMPFADKGPLRIVISGASGMIGTALTQFLSNSGHEVRALVRRQHTKESDIFWNPSANEIDKNALENVDVVIHLAGENIGAGRWTAARKKKILESRVKGTQLLAEALASLKNPPKVFISSSAIGFYGNRGDEVLTEESAAGKGFLTEVCEAWEKATEPAKAAGIRVVNIRTGIVLSANGGALPKMVLPMLMGAGGIIGTGKQWMSWISLEDLVGIFHYAIYHDKLSGPVNATAPWSATNKSFTKILGVVLKRPTFAPLPGFVVKILFGEMGEALLLEGQQVKPEKLTKEGFEFLYPDLESALRWELGRFR